MKFIAPEIEGYAIAHSTCPSELCDELENYTRENVEMSAMLIGKMEASFLGFLIRSHNVKRVLEIGTYTGYSALSMAENLPPNGELITLDINPETNKIAQEFWRRSPHGSKIKSYLGPALESLTEVKDGIDLCFIDADKTNYVHYLEKVLPKLSPGGFVVLDNVLWDGKVLLEDSELAQDDEATKALKKLNQDLINRTDLYVTMVPIRDGITLIKKLDL